MQVLLLLPVRVRSRTEGRRKVSIGQSGLHGPVLAEAPSERSPHGYRHLMVGRRYRLSVTVVEQHLLVRSIFIGSRNQGRSVGRRKGSCRKTAEPAERIGSRIRSVSRHQSHRPSFFLLILMLSLHFHACPILCHPPAVQVALLHLPLRRCLFALRHIGSSYPCGNGLQGIRKRYFLQIPGLIFLIGRCRAPALSPRFLQ